MCVCVSVCVCVCVCVYVCVCVCARGDFLWFLFGLISVCVSVCVGVRLRVYLFGFYFIIFLLLSGIVFFSQHCMDADVLDMMHDVYANSRGAIIFLAFRFLIARKLQAIGCMDW